MRRSKSDRGAKRVSKSTYVKHTAFRACLEFAMLKSARSYKSGSGSDSATLRYTALHILHCTTGTALHDTTGYYTRPAPEPIPYDYKYAITTTATATTAATAALISLHYVRPG